jgi:hypothetical protein
MLLLISIGVKTRIKSSFEKTFKKKPTLKNQGGLFTKAVLNVKQVPGQSLHQQL